MKVFLVRHAQTKIGAQGLHQPLDAELSSEGEKQALQVAEKLSSLNIDYIISSDMKRAKETAEIIAKKLQKEVEYTDLLVEQRRPSEIVNESRNDPMVLDIKDELSENSHDPLWHYSDEENYYDLLDRVMKSLELIESQNVDNLLVVSHKITIKMLLGVMVHGSDLAPSMGERIIKSFEVDNASITTAEYLDGNWKILGLQNF